MGPKAQGANAIVISIILIGVLLFYYGGDKIISWWDSNTKEESSENPKEKSAFWTVLEKVIGEKERAEKVAERPRKKVSVKPPKKEIAREKVEEIVTSQAPYPSYGILGRATSYYNSAGGQAIGKFPSKAEIDIIDWPQDGAYTMVSYNGFSGWVSKSSVSELQDLYGKEWVKK